MISVKKALPILAIPMVLAGCQNPDSSLMPVISKVTTQQVASSTDTLVTVDYTAARQVVSYDLTIDNGDTRHINSINQVDSDTISFRTGALAKGNHNLSVSIGTLNSGNSFPATANFTVQ